MEDFLLNGDMLLFGKLLLALLLGLALGFERTIAGKMAGMRTYALVSMGSCLLVMVSSIVFSQYSFNTGFNPLSVAGGIITGIGFICGGLIIFTDEKLVGLTSSAGMWVAASIGITVGFGLTTLAIFATILTLITFTILWKLEEGIRKLSNENARD
jgi:putative Mg2+ transporter-C (MgtC) family protein